MTLKAITFNELGCYILNLFTVIQCQEKSCIPKAEILQLNLNAKTTVTHAHGKFDSLVFSQWIGISYLLFRSKQLSLEVQFPEK